MDIKKKVELFLWKIIPRVYPCRDVILIKWLNSEFILRK